MQEEVEGKPRKLKKLWGKFKTAQAEIQDLQNEFQREKEDILANLDQFHLATQIYSGLLNNVTSELASKMTAMDSATTNANAGHRSPECRLARLRTAAGAARR